MQFSEAYWVSLLSHFMIYWAIQRSFLYSLIVQLWFTLKWLFQSVSANGRFYSMFPNYRQASSDTLLSIQAVSKTLSMHLLKGGVFFLQNVHLSKPLSVGQLHKIEKLLLLYLILHHDDISINFTCIYKKLRFYCSKNIDTAVFDKIKDF